MKNVNPVSCVVFVNSMKGQKELKRWAAKNQLDSRQLNAGFYKYRPYVYCSVKKSLQSVVSPVGFGECCGNDVALFKKICLELYKNGNRKNEDFQT